MNFAATTKQEIIAELHMQIAAGAALLQQALPKPDALSRASMDRASWSLKNKKLLHALLGDSAGLATAHGHNRADELSGHPTHEQEAHQFRRLVEDQLAYLEKVSLLLQRLA